MNDEWINLGYARVCGTWFDESAAWSSHPRKGQVIDGEVVDAPRVLADVPAGPPPAVRCAQHPDWMRCETSWRDCVQYNQPAEEPDERTWTERRTTFRVVDRRRASVWRP